MIELYLAALILTVISLIINRGTKIIDWAVLLICLGLTQIVARLL